MTTAQDGGRLSALRIGRFYPQEILLVLISVRGWIDHSVIVRSEGFYVNEKSNGIEPATLRFVAQRLNHCATAVPCYLVAYRDNLSIYLGNNTKENQMCIPITGHIKNSPNYAVVNSPPNTRDDAKLIPSQLTLPLFIHEHKFQYFSHECPCLQREIGLILRLKNQFFYAIPLTLFAWHVTTSLCSCHSCIILDTFWNRTHQGHGGSWSKLYVFFISFFLNVKNIKNTFLGRSLLRMDENATNNRHIWRHKSTRIRHNSHRIEEQGFYEYETEGKYTNYEELINVKS